MTLLELTSLLCMLHAQKVNKGDVTLIYLPESSELDVEGKDLLSRARENPRVDERVVHNQRRDHGEVCRSFRRSPCWIGISLYCSFHRQPGWKCVIVGGEEQVSSFLEQTCSRE